MEKEILNMDEAAELFGVSVKTFIKLLKEEKVPGRKIGREWRFSRKALIEWLSSGDSQAYSASEGDTKEFFNEVAPTWDDIRKNCYDESIRDKMIETKVIKKGMTVIDLGAGDGYISISAAQYAKKVIAVDISKEMLKQLSKKAKENGLKNIQTVEGDGRDIPLDGSIADAVCASMYLHHIEDPDLAIKEIYRVLKPGGIVFLADFFEHHNMHFKEEMHDIWPGFETRIVSEWFKKNGFSNINIEKNSKVEASGYKEILSIFYLTAIK